MRQMACFRLQNSFTASFGVPGLAVIPQLMLIEKKKQPKSKQWQHVSRGADKASEMTGWMLS